MRRTRVLLRVIVADLLDELSIELGALALVNEGAQRILSGDQDGCRGRSNSSTLSSSKRSLNQSCEKRNSDN